MRYAIVVLAALVVSPAFGQSLGLLCQPYDRATVAEKMAGYGEQIRAAGSAIRGQAVFSVWVHPETRDWTITMRHADGNFCIVAAGQGWTEHTVTPGEDS